MSGFASCLNRKVLHHEAMTTAAATRPWAERQTNQEVLEAARAEGFTPLQQRLLARRLKSVPESGLRKLVRPTTKELPRASKMPDILLAAKTIADAIIEKKVICCASDSDCDGVSSASVLWQALRKVFKVSDDRLHIMTAERHRDGYGVSEGYVDRILQLDPRPSLVITADQGSADEARIKRLKEEGIATVVTDHHQIPSEGTPPSAVACVNPVRPDSEFGDPNICGAVVAWYVMVAVQHELRERGVDAGTANEMMEPADFLATSVVADVVDLSLSYTNRWAVQTGLDAIRQLRRPIWRAFAPMIKEGWDSMALGWSVGPRINCLGRMGDAKRGVYAMCAEDDATAKEWVELLDRTNQERKKVQATLVVRALDMAQAQMSDGMRGLVLTFLVDGHSGVHGIVASRVVELTGLPTVCLCPTDDDPELLTGSIRSVEGAHVKNMLDDIRAAHPEWKITGGGHAGAGGLRFPLKHLGEFMAAWHQACSLALPDGLIAPRLHDGGMGQSPRVHLLSEIEELEPFGRGFESPTFADHVFIRRVRELGKDGKHAQLEVQFADGSIHRMVWFNCREDGRMPLTQGEAHLLYEFRRSSFSGGPGYDLQVKELLH